MKIALSNDAHTFLQAVEAVLNDFSTPQQVREAWSDIQPARWQLWPHLCKIGLTGVTRSPERGGGLPFEDLMPVLEAAGRRATAVPLVESIGAGCPVLAAEPGRRAEEILADLDSGEAFLSVQDGWNGWAPWAAEARYVLVLEDSAVAVCQPQQGQVELLLGQDHSRHIGRVSPDSRSWVLIQPGAAQRLRGHLLVSTAATMNGLSEGALWQAVEYAKVRQQFGRPIGSFQAVRHRLGAVFARLEFTRRYVYYAAWAVANDRPDAIVAARRAKAVAGDVAVEASYAAFQVHGGVGYTWECDLHLWMKRIQALDSAYGTSESHWESLALRFDEQAATR